MSIRRCPICDRHVYYGIYCNTCHYDGRVERYERTLVIRTNEKKRNVGKKGEKQ